MTRQTLFSNKIAFAIGTGRCGTKFLHKIFSLESGIASVHERNPLNETFHRYCKWYGIDIDHLGFLYTKEREINEDLKKYHFSFESSAYLSLSVKELYDYFNCKFILLVRSPHKVVNSYIHKGWYDQPIVRLNPNKPITYQDSEHFHHFLGRIVPCGQKFNEWQKMTQIGKVAWFWNTLNMAVLEQFKEIPTTHWRVDRLEDLDYTKYQEILDFLGIRSQVNRQEYQAIATARPNSFSGIPSILSWTDAEISEFESEVFPIASRLSYEYRVHSLANSKN